MAGVKLSVPSLPLPVRVQPALGLFLQPEIRRPHRGHHRGGGRDRGPALSCDRIFVVLRRQTGHDETFPHTAREHGGRRDEEGLQGEDRYTALPDRHLADTRGSGLSLRVHAGQDIYVDPFAEHRQREDHRGQPGARHRGRARLRRGGLRGLGGLELRRDQGALSRRPSSVAQGPRGLPPASGRIVQERAKAEHGRLAGRSSRSTGGSRSPSSPTRGS